MSTTVAEIDRVYDEISYHELFREHSRLIFKLIHNFVNGTNINLHQTEIDDIYQEVALKIFKNDYLSKYKEEKSSFITWLNIICRTATIDYYRRNMRWMKYVLSDTDQPDRAADAPPPAFSLPAGVLTARQTEVITLYFKEGLTACEIAAGLDITARTVRSLKFQALERLRAHYGASAPPPVPRYSGPARRENA